MGVAWHRFLAFFNIYFKREESGGVALGALRPIMSDGKPLNFEEADPEKDVFGAGKVEDFSWKGWLDFSTCTECGRCQSQCPAWNTAKPLSPKIVILALRDHAFAKAPYLAAGGGTDMAGVERLSEARLQELAHSDPLAMLEAGRPLIGGPEVNGIIDPEVLWDCTTCGACVEQCPVDIEHVDHIVDMRRYQVMIESEFPSELGGLFRNLENKGNPWGQNQRDRMEWAKGLDFEVPVITDVIGDDHEYLFWVGCAGAFEDKAKKTTRAVAELLHMAAVGFAVLGTGETCSGDPARRAGNEFLFQMLAQQNVETINAAFGGRKQKKIVVSCAHCFNTLLNEYPQLGGEYEVVHHTQLLNKLVRDKRLVRAVNPGQPVEMNVTYHDPCYLGRHNKVYTPPRELIGAAGSALSEMPRNSARSMCCGAGGARMWMEEKIGKQINVERTDEALGLDPDIVSTACPFCMVMLSDAVTAKQQSGQAREDVQVLDVSQILARSLKPASAAVPAAAPAPSASGGGTATAVLDAVQPAESASAAEPAESASAPQPAESASAPQISEDVTVEAPKPVEDDPAETAVADHPQLAQETDTPTTDAGQGPQDAPSPERSTGTPGDAPGGKSEHQQVGPPTAPPA